MEKWTWNLVFLLAISLLLVACSSTDDEVTTEEATIKVGTMGTYHPFSYENEAGELTGYDLEAFLV